MVVPEPTVVHEDRDLIVINKPSGLQVHAAKISGKRRDASRAQEPTLTDWLLARYPELAHVGDDPVLRPGIVHRLDKETSGIMLVPRNQEYFAYLKERFQKHEVRKTYLAVVHGAPKQKSGVINAPIGIRNGTLKRSVRSEKMAKPAVTEWRVVKTFPAPTGGAGGSALLEVMPQTGRTHQIRVHLASIGLPVAGDRLYGLGMKGIRKKAGEVNAAQKEPVQRLMLHAAAIEFVTPAGRRVRFEADPPEEFSEWLSTT